MNGHGWFAGLTVDHLYADCPNRTRAEQSLRHFGLWDVGNASVVGSLVDPEGDLICGLCAHRWRRSQPVAATNREGTP